jgi:hypothetical protein
MIYYMPESTTLPPRPGPPSRGVSPRDVELAADALLRSGERPTIERVREKIGRGSPNTINPALDAWWKRLASRLDAGPAALHRLPETVAHVAEALWMQALEESRRRASLEQQSGQRAATAEKQALEVRSHVLTLREAEFESRLRDRERSQTALEAHLQDLTLLLRKERATREAQSKRITALEEELFARARKPAMGKTPPKAATRAKPKHVAKPLRLSPHQNRKPTLRKKPPTRKRGQ